MSRTVTGWMKSVLSRGSHEVRLTGQVPPAMILSKDKRSGMPLLVQEQPDLIED